MSTSFDVQWKKGPLDLAAMRSLQAIYGEDNDKLQLNLAVKRDCYESGRMAVAMERDIRQ